MPAAAQWFDPDALAHDAASSAALAAFTRDVNLTSHVDARLPGKMLGPATCFREFLRERLARTVAEYADGQVALALWKEERPGGRPGLLIEVCASRTTARTPGMLSRVWLSDLPALEFEQAYPANRVDAERVLLRLSARPAPQADTVADRWRELFEGSALVDLRPLLFDRQRYRESAAAVGLNLSLPASDGEALERLEAAARQGRTGLLLLDAHQALEQARRLARRARQHPSSRLWRIVLSGVTRRVSLAPGEDELFDAVVRVATPWRSLHEVVRDFRQLAADGAADASERAEAEIPSLAGCRILVAEDVATNQVLLRALLEATGATVEAVESGAEVIRRHSAEPADLIVMDLEMPGMGGIAAVRRIRDLPADAGRVPVIAITAYAREEDRRTALEAGMDAYLVKPVVVPQLYGLVARLVAGRGSGGAAGR